MFISVVYDDGTFKTTPLTCWNPQGEMTLEIWYKSSQVDINSTRYYSTSINICFCVLLHRVCTEHH